MGDPLPRLPYRHRVGFAHGVVSCAVVLVRWLLLLSAHDKNEEGRAWNFFLIFLETTWALTYGLV